MSIKPFRNAVLACLALAVPLSILAADYPSGRGALEVFDDAAMKAAPQWMKIWLMIMLAGFAAGLFFVRRHPIARWVVGGFLSIVVLVGGIAPALNIPLLSGFLGLCHVVCWSPGLYLLLSKRPFMGATTAFSIWSAVITAIILFSFVFDIPDAFIYLQHVFTG